MNRAELEIQISEARAQQRDRAREIEAFANLLLARLYDMGEHYPFCPEAHRLGLALPNREPTP